MADSLEPNASGSRGRIPEWLGRLWDFPGWILGLGALAVLILALYAAQQREPLATFSTSCLISAASLLSGALVGFIFGVPRVLTADRPRPSIQDERASLIVANTNLEQISDWLTKILVGIGLTQFPAIASAAGRLFAAIGPSLSPGTSGVVFAGALVVSAVATGFIGGWLSARLWLGKRMAEADTSAQVIDLMTKAQRASSEGDVDTANQLREEAQNLIERRTEIAQDYEMTRLNMRPGTERTRQMERSVEAARNLAKQISLEPDHVADLLRGERAGDHILALGFMEARPELVDVDLLVKTISNPSSNFEQYHALRAGLGAMPRLSPGDREKLAQAAVEARPRMGHDGSRTNLVSLIEAAATGKTR
ncbi:hypothetical protein ACWEOW_18530 [Monashia sp. NPDC004114]